MENWITKLNDWNLILILIGLISLLALSIFIERIVKLHRKEIDSRSFLFSLRQTLKQGSL
jgi:biopolymer transport protein ExbB